MSSIVAGRFQTFDQAESAVDALVIANFKRKDLNIFYVNPPGQHDATPIGGDHLNADPGARDITNDAVTGAAAGGAIGLAAGIAAAVPVVGAAVAVAAAGVGAYTGSFAGGLAGAGDSDHPTPAPRRSGVLVAVRSENDQVTTRATVVLNDHGAADLEMADGTWRDGKWIDFDPVTPPRFISAPMDLP